MYGLKHNCPRVPLLNNKCKRTSQIAIWSMYKLALIFKNAITLERSQNNCDTALSTILFWTEWVTWLYHMTKNVSSFLKASVYTVHTTTFSKNSIFAGQKHHLNVDGRPKQKNMCFQTKTYQCGKGLMCWFFCGLHNWNKLLEKLEKIFVIIF